MFYVYLHLRLDDGSVFYVGKGQRNRAYSVRNRNTHWKGIVAKHGRSVHLHSQWENETEAFAEEIRLIAGLRAAGIPLVNLTNGGEGPSGHIHSSETREKIKLNNARGGRPGTMRGRTHSVKTREKISAANRNPSAEIRAKISATSKERMADPGARMVVSLAQKGNTHRLGHIHSVETRTKMSKAHKERTLRSTNQPTAEQESQLRRICNEKD